MCINTALQYKIYSEKTD